MFYAVLVQKNQYGLMRILGLSLFLGCCLGGALPVQAQPQALRAFWARAWPIIRNFVADFTASEGIEAITDDTKKRIETLEKIVEQIETRDRWESTLGQTRRSADQERIDRLEQALVKVLKQSIRAADQVVVFLDSDEPVSARELSPGEVDRLVDQRIGPVFAQLQQQMQRIDELAARLERHDLTFQELDRRIAKLDGSIEDAQNRLDDLEMGLERARRELWDALRPLQVIAFWKDKRTLFDGRSRRHPARAQLIYWQVRLSAQITQKEIEVTFAFAPETSPKDAPWVKLRVTAIQTAVSATSATYRLESGYEDLPKTLSLEREAGKRWLVSRLCRPRKGCIEPANARSDEPRFPPEVQKEEP